MAVNPVSNPRSTRYRWPNGRSMLEYPVPTKLSMSSGARVVPFEGAWATRQPNGTFGPLVSAPTAPLRSPRPPGGLRYLSLMALPGGTERLYYEFTRADGAHELRTELVHPKGSAADR